MPDLWQDATSYAQGERGVIEPTCWRIYIGEAKLVAKLVRRKPNEEWMLYAPDFGRPRNEPLRTKDLEEAKRSALILCAKTAFRMRWMYADAHAFMKRILEPRE